MRTAISGVRTIGVPVTDQDRAVDFYVGTLGFDQRLDVPVEQLGGRWIEVAPDVRRPRSGRQRPRDRRKRMTNERSEQ